MIDIGSHYELSDSNTRYKCISIPDLQDLAIDAFFGDSLAMQNYESALRIEYDIYRYLFNNLQSEKIDIFYYDQGKAENFNRYMFTRSVKEPGKIQKSCLWYKGNDMIPLSDRNRKTWEEFKREGDLPDGITIYYN